MSRPRPPDEAERLAQLHALLVLDSEPEALFDRIAALASEICGAPIALVSLVDEERQWFKANVGMTGISETPRDVAFCAHAIGSAETMVVPDATADARFRDNPLVTGPPDIRFYAGAPLTLRDGARIGTLCVIDRQARTLEPTQSASLERLAALVSAALEMRRDLIRRALAARSAQERALAESEARFRALVEQQNELVSLARPDGELVYVNPAYADHFGREVSEVVGANLFDFIDPVDHLVVRRRVDEVLERDVVLTGENRTLRPDGSECWVAWTNSLHIDAQGHRLLHSVGRDVTSEREAQRALARQSAVLQAVTAVLPVLVAVVGADRRYRFVNDGFLNWVGRASSEVLGRTMAEVLGETEYERTRPWFERALAGQAVSFDKTYTQRADGRHLAIRLTPLRIEGDRVDGVVAVAQDFTEHKREADRLLELAQRDPLTGLLNRAGFDEYLDGQRATGGDTALALLYVDLDLFKEVNDRHGHAIGDQLLQAFARRAQNLVRPTDAVVRLGGDEFVVVLSGVRERAHAVSVADKLIEAARGPFHFGDSRIETGASIGLAFGQAGEDSGSELLARADAQLYRAKQAGRGRLMAEPD